MGLRALHLTPNILTVAGLVVCAASAALIALGYLLPGGIVLFFASLFDMFDGALAHVTGTTHRYGAFLDSTVDRYAESFTYIALLYYFMLRQHAVLEPMLIIVALMGSMLVSYVRARAQSLGFTVDRGLLARPERVFITVTGLILTPLLIWALWILAVMTNVTAIQRIWIVWNQSRRSPAADS
ncbi:MAG: CDP-alcohol phosphatidyltransferase family protein [Candidatus Dormibacteria bacterium]